MGMVSRGLSAGKSGPGASSAIEPVDAELPPRPRGPGSGPGPGRRASWSRRRWWARSGGPPSPGGRPGQPLAAIRSSRASPRWAGARAAPGHRNRRPAGAARPARTAAGAGDAVRWRAPCHQAGSPGPGAAQHLGPVPSNLRVGQARDVFQHDRARADLLGQPQRLGEQVTLVGGAELLAADRERRARRPSGEQVHAAKARRPARHVAFEDLPAGWRAACRRRPRPVRRRPRGRTRPVPGLVPGHLPRRRSPGR